MKLASPVPLWLLVTQSRLCSGEWKRDVRIARGSSLLSQPQFGASHLPALRESRAAEGPHGEQWVLLAGSSLSASAETGPSLVALTLASPTTVPGTVAQQD